MSDETALRALIVCLKSYSVTYKCLPYVDDEDTPTLVKIQQIRQDELGDDLSAWTNGALLGDTIIFCKYDGAFARYLQSVILGACVAFGDDAFL
jgi:hypothetical protein